MSRAASALSRSCRRSSAPRAVLLALVVCAGPAHGLGSGWDSFESGEHDRALEAFGSSAAPAGGERGASLGAAAILLGRGEIDAAFERLAAGLDGESDARLLAGSVAGMATLVRQLGHAPPESIADLDRLLDAREELDPEVRSVALLARADLALRAGSREVALGVIRERSGRIETWTLLGPYGRFRRLSFDRPFAPELDAGVAQDAASAGASEGRVYEVTARFPDGRIVLPPAMQRPGAAYAAAELEVDRATLIRIRVSGPTSAKLFVDGVPAISLDRWRERPPSAVSVRVRLEPGLHRLLVKVPAIADDGYASVDLGVIEGAPPRIRAARDLGAATAASAIEPSPSSLDEETARRAGDSPADALAAWWWLQTRALDEAAGRVLLDAANRWPDAPVFAWLAGEHRLASETGAAPQEDLVRARSFLEDALGRAPDLARATLWLGRMELGADRLDDAWSRVDDALARAPDDPALLRLAFEVADARGWSIEAAQLLDRALLVAPDDPELLAAALAFLTRTGAIERASTVARRLSARQLNQPARALRLSAAGRHDEAIAEWEELVTSQPTAPPVWSSLVRARMDAGLMEQALATIERADALLPDDPLMTRDRATLLALTGERDASVAAHERLLALDPGNLHVRMALERLGRAPRMDGYLADARAVLEDAGPRARGVDSALLADIAVVQIDERGGQTELYQGVHKVYTRAGVENEGELDVLGGALVESIRLHKPDRRIVDVAPGAQRPVSIPGLESGDAIEYVWRRYIAPLAGLPGAIDNQTLFVFQSRDRDHVLSRYVIAHEPDLPVEVCGNMRDLETSDEIVDGMRVRNFTARAMPRLRVEPHVPDLLEITPHVRLGLAMSWQDIGDRYRDALIGSLRPVEPLPTLAAEVRRRASADDPLALARALHDVVQEELRPGSSSLQLILPASAFASSGEGNRAGVALALARILGLDARLVLARPLERRGLALDCPSPGQFGYVLVEIAHEDRVVYLDLTGFDSPFDALPRRLSASDALRVPLDAARPVEIIALPAQEQVPLQQLSARLRLDAEGRASGLLDVVLHAEVAGATRSVVQQVAGDRLPLVHRTVASNVFAGAEVTKARIEGADAQGGALAFHLEIERGEWARRTPDGFAVPLTTEPLDLHGEFAPIESRLHPLLLDPQGLRSDVTRIELPAGLLVGPLEPPVELDTRFGSYRLEVRHDGDELVIEREVLIPPQRVEPEHYGKFREFAREIAEVERREIALSVSSPSLAR